MPMNVDISPYMVSANYYHSSQWIASRLGDYWNRGDPSVDAEEELAVADSLWLQTTTIIEPDYQDMEGDFQYIETDGSNLPIVPYGPYISSIRGFHAEDILWGVFNGSCRADDGGMTDDGVFYYHPDHLGSATWITSDRGQAVQYLHYMPFGELWENQQASEYNERFKFTGKERDAETGYDYFGARYYSPMLGHWLSVDPLSDEQPHITPYAYCKWSPINRFDPDGMIDYDMVRMGLGIMAISGGTAVGGTMVSTTGLGAPVGALLIVDGIAGVGIGASLCITGLLTDPNEQNTYIMNNIPTNATSAITKSTDQIAGNKHHQIEYTIDGILIVAGGKPSLKDAKEFYAAAATLTQAIQLGKNIKKEIPPADPPVGAPLQSEGLPNDNTQVVSNYLDKRQYSIEYE